MTRPIQITSSSAIHQLPISSSLVVTNNDDIVQNLIQFLVQNSHSLLLSSFTNNYIVGSWTFNPPKMQTPLSLQYLCKHPFGPISFWTVKEKLLILTLQKIFSKWHWYSKNYDCSLNRNKNYDISPIRFPNFGHTFRFPTSGRPSEQQLCL